MRIIDNDAPEDNLIVLKYFFHFGMGPSLQSGPFADIKRQIIENMEGMPHVQFLESNNVSRAQFITFMRERLAQAPYLEPLLEKSLVLSNESGYLELESVLQENLNDEMGGAPEVRSDQFSHGFSRKVLSQFIGLDWEEVTQKEIEYIDPIQKILNSDDLPFVTGAVYYPEATIPREFTPIRNTFRRLYAAELEQYGGEVQPDYYLSDHILHDAEDHEPKIRKAAENVFKTSDEQSLFVEGVAFMESIKRKNAERILELLDSVT